MGKKMMKLQWPSCKYPKTLSFRAAGAVDDDIFKTVNSVFFDPCIDNNGVEVQTPESWFTNSSLSESASYSTESHEDHPVDNESLEIIVREARSERLFFDPGGETSSILEEAKSSSSSSDEAAAAAAAAAFSPFKESVVLAMDSENPYVDFRRSMEEMVETHGLIKDWDCLEELLGWYLRVNGKKHHGFIVDAFVDLLASFAAAAPTNHNHHHDSTYFSAISSFNYSSSSSLSPNLGSNRQIYDDEKKLVVS
ncbi:transcription repressor OFP13 [Citrus sinensis]|uniref:Transcription repressor n=2 Tax=Citrus TaxID=2706 RepID=V4TZG7_CITCL|nr:transcription repressor OFP13 [Citrus x clementina]XP_006485467.1 transcription repressor OFP13 [Citrus sinensis]ESR59007.1 hypothetical protein CICLE_v10016377mg [Citrus x clementina]KAH9704667.1 transcription repressor OFP13 [Citrus sinensis]GAY59848.1 hypothetical protein CUMW_197610 [Citrus unshiu]